MSNSATPWAVAQQAPLSTEFSRQQNWNGLPFPSPGDLPNTGFKPGFPSLQADSLPSEPPGKPGYFIYALKIRYLWFFIFLDPFSIAIACLLILFRLFKKPVLLTAFKKKYTHKTMEIKKYKRELGLEFWFILLLDILKDVLICFILTQAKKCCKIHIFLRKIVRIHRYY